MTYRPVGKCIYCSKTENLSKEHIIPYGLNGSIVLPKASCRDCAKITGLFEREVLRGPMRNARIHRALQSRRGHAGAPVNQTLTVIIDGEEKTVALPLSEFPILLQFPVFPPPAAIAPEGYVSGIYISGHATISFGESPHAVLKKLRASEIRIDQNYRHDSFARLIAKIAYAFAVAEGWVDLLDGQPLVIPAILGQRDEIRLWVGTITNPLQAHEGMLHLILPHLDQERGKLIVEVQLFADSPTPSYGVIIGNLKAASST